MRLSNCALRCSKKSKFIKEQEASRIIGTFAKPLSQIPSVGPILFERYEMNEIRDTFLLARNKLRSEMHLG